MPKQPSTIGGLVPGHVDKSLRTLPADVVMKLGLLAMIWAKFEFALDVCVNGAFFISGMPKSRQKFPRATEEKIEWLQAAFSGASKLQPLAKDAEEILLNSLKVKARRNKIAHADIRAHTPDSIYIQYVRIPSGSKGKKAILVTEEVKFQELEQLMFDVAILSASVADLRVRMKDLEQSVTLTPPPRPQI